MNPLTTVQGVASALSAVGSAIVGKPDNSSSSLGDYGNTVTSGAPISSGGGSASAGVNLNSLAIWGAIGFGAFFLIKHFFKK